MSEDQAEYLPKRRKPKPADQRLWESLIKDLRRDRNAENITVSRRDLRELLEMVGSIRHALNPNPLRTMVQRLPKEEQADLRARVKDLESRPGGSA